MSSPFEVGEDHASLLREVIASNLTVAYLLELQRRAGDPDPNPVHPLASVLDVFDTIQEVLLPDDDERDEIPSASQPPPDLTVGRVENPEGSPFESTIRYLRARRRK